jgi:hypothetical protein
VIAFAGAADFGAGDGFAFGDGAGDVAAEDAQFTGGVAELAQHRGDFGVLFVAFEIDVEV